jgi:hypothetical protein
MVKAIVTLAVGERCWQPWYRFLATGWRQWCDLHGYQLIVFDQLLDLSPRASRRSPAWQKLLAMASPQLASVDQALWVDADVLIRPGAPDPWEGLDPRRVAMVRDVGSPLAEQPIWFKNSWCAILNNSLPANQHSLQSYYNLWGFSAHNRILRNSGVVAFSPRHHSDLFREIYGRWEDGGEGALYEMIPLNLELNQRKLIADLDVRFNQLVGVQRAVWISQRQAVQELHGMGAAPLDQHNFLDLLLERSYFLHFAGAHQLMLEYLRNRDPGQLLPLNS